MASLTVVISCRWAV